MIAAAKKETGLGDLFKGYIPQQLEEKSVVKVEPSGIVTDVFNLYLTYLQDESCYSKQDIFGVSYTEIKFGVVDDIYERVKPVDADQLTAFLEATKTCTRFEHQDALFSAFIESLIQKSYDAGYNDFVIDSSQIPRQHSVILDDMCGTAQRPLHVTLKTKRPNLYLGNITYLGKGIKHRTTGTEHCLFEVYGDLRSPNEYPPYGDGAKYCTYVHHGALYVKEQKEPNDFDIPDHCVFKTSNRKTARELQKIVRRFPQMPYKSITPSAYSNIIYFIDSEGKEHQQ